MVPATFCIGIKLNSADHNSGDFDATVRQIELLIEAGIDFLEVRGGSAEDPKVLLSYPDVYVLLLYLTSYLLADDGP